MKPVVHFEIPYADPERTARFYQTVYVWHTQALGEETGGFILAATAESDARLGLTISQDFAGLPMEDARCSCN